MLLRTVYVIQTGRNSHIQAFLLGKKKDKRVGQTKNVTRAGNNCEVTFILMKIMKN
jgi:hypothetical protein